MFKAKKETKEIQELKEKITEQEIIILSKAIEIFSLEWQLDELKKLKGVK